MYCKHPRYKSPKKRGRRSKPVPYKWMHYLPLIPRLKRLYASSRSAKHMRWHAENMRDPSVVYHPSDSEAYKHFDRKHPNFALDPRNVRLGLCANGFNPFNNNDKPYSCWPIIVTPYNLPPKICMSAPYMFLTRLIPGPHNLKSRIDVYLQPLIDELK
ncbi:hypothetical protein ACH5RR_029300 [Cinchona calisaya]|uniref:Uncharacterized protein n=1 Tax=Cinchona calisaya TaxID=153742 RepID=A0ABD2YSX4_9GENT